MTHFTVAPSNFSQKTIYDLFEGQSVSHDIQLGCRYQRKPCFPSRCFPTNRYESRYCSRPQAEGPVSAPQRSAHRLHEDHIHETREKSGITKYQATSRLICGI